MELTKIIQKFIDQEKKTSFHFKLSKVDPILELTYIDNFQAIINDNYLGNVICIQRMNDVKLTKKCINKKCQSYKLDYGNCSSYSSFVYNEIPLCWKHSYLLSQQGEH